MSTSHQALLSGNRLCGPTSIKLPDLSRAVAKLTGGPTRGYRVFYNLVLDGKLPAERDKESGRTWRVRAEHVPEIVRLWGFRFLSPLNPRRAWAWRLRLAAPIRPTRPPPPLRRPHKREAPARTGNRGFQATTCRRKTTWHTTYSIYGLDRKARFASGGKLAPRCFTAHCYNPSARPAPRRCPPFTPAGWIAKRIWPSNTAP